MNKYIQLTLFQSFLFHFQMLLDSSHIFLLMISIVCGGIVHMCMWVHVSICMHAEASEEQRILIFLCLCQFYCFETDLSLNLRLIISARRARQFSGFVYLGSPPTPCTGVKGTHGQAQFLCRYWGIQSQVVYTESTLIHKATPSPHHWYLAQCMSWEHTLNDF